MKQDKVIAITSIESYVGKEKVTENTCIINDSFYIDYQGKNKTIHFDRISKVLLKSMQNLCSKSRLSDMEKAGVYLGTQFSSINSVFAFDMKSLKDSPLSVNPNLFPDTVLNAPSSQLSIEFLMENENFTVANGLNASLDAIGLAYESVLHGKTKMALAGGFDEWGDIQVYSYCSRKKVAEAVGLAVIEQVDSKLAEERNYVQLSSYISKNVKKNGYISVDMISDFFSNELGKISSQNEKVDVYISSLLSQSEEKEIFQFAAEKCGYELDLHYYDEIYMGATGIINIADFINEQHSDSSLAMIINLNQSVLSCLILRHKK